MIDEIQLGDNSYKTRPVNGIQSALFGRLQKADPILGTGYLMGVMVDDPDLALSHPSRDPNSLRYTDIEVALFAEKAYLHYYEKFGRSPKLWVDFNDQLLKVFNSQYDLEKKSS